MTDVQKLLDNMPEDMRRDVMFGAVNAFKDLVAESITNLETHALSREPFDSADINGVRGSADILRTVFGIEIPTR